MFEMVWLQIVALEVSLETHKTKKTNWKGGAHYFQEESLNLEKLVDPISEIVCEKKNSDILNWAVNAALITFFLVEVKRTIWISTGQCGS